MTISVSLPADAKVLLKAGQKVDFRTPLVDIPTTGTVVIQAATHLGIAPKDIFLTMQKTVGEEVVQGNLLAQKKSLLSKKDLTSPVAGIIKEINHQDGTIVLQTKEQNTNMITCFFTGEVESIKDNELQLKVNNAKELSIVAATASFGGPMAFITQQDLLTITENEVKGRVVYIEDLTAYDQSKIEALGAVGFLTMKMDEADSRSKAAVLGKGVAAKDLQNTGKTYCIIDKKTSKLYLYD